MTVRNGDFPGDYYRNNIDTPGGYDDGPGSPDVSEGSNCFKRKFTCTEDEPFGVPRVVLPMSSLSSSERNNLIHRLRQELEQIRSYRKDVDLPRSNGVISTPAGNLSRAKSFGMSRCSTGLGKKVLPLSAARPAPVTACAMLQMKQCEALLKRLMVHQYGWLFKTPVDVVKMNIPDYFTIIKHPMDLGTVKSKLTAGTYSCPSEFSADVRLTFSNAMTYNPPGNDVYIMADTLGKFFEVRWKTIEKKSPGTKSKPSNSGPSPDSEIAMPTPLAKKRKMNAVIQDSDLEPVKRVMADEDRVKLGRDLGSLTEFPVHIINFLRDHSSKVGGLGDDEIEIDINVLSHDALFQLRDLLDEFSRENQKKDASGEPCVLELLHGSGPENSLVQHCDGSEMEDEDVEIGNYEHRKSRISPVKTEKGSSSSESVPDDRKPTRLTSSPKMQGPESMDSESPVDGARSTSPKREPSVCGLDQLEDGSKEKPSSVEGADCHQDGNSAQTEKELPPEKRYRAALLKNRFADLIFKAREKTLNQNEKRDPEKLRREREELELQKKKEKARLQAEAKEAEEARRKAEAQAAAEAAAEAKRKLEVEREAARQALLEMEKSVEINENSRFLKDLELLKTVNTDHLTSIREDDDDGLGVLGFGGSNALEQLGLFMKHDEDEDDADVLASPEVGNEIEEGEID